MEFANALTNNRTWNRHGLKIVWAIAVLVFGLVVALIAYSEYRNHQKRQSDYKAQVLPPIATNQAPKYRVSDITSANLFGDPTPKKAVVKNTPVTKLNLKLVGVLWATDQNMARVIIESGGKKAGLYGVGESIKGAGASVKEIHSNEILISRNGATEKLPLVKKQSGKDIITYDVVSYADNQQYEQVPASFDSGAEIGRSNRLKPTSPNGENRKIRKPNFSGLDRALQKMGEI